MALKHKEITLHFKTETIVGIFILAATALFLYISFQLGSLRFDVSNHAYYTLSFKDIAGLAQKAEVKIAGVKVGWVDSVELVPEDMTVKLGLKILKVYKLHNDMQALIRQEGLLGAKFLEILPGVEGPTIPSGSALPFQKRQFVSMDELFYSFQKIARAIEKVGANSQDITHQAQEFLAEMKKSLATVNELVQRFGNCAQGCSENFTSTVQAIKDAALDMSAMLKSAQEPVRQLGELTQKIYQGEGSLGKMLTDTHVYDDVTYTAQLAKNCFERVRGCSAAVDTHLEVLPQRHRTNVKGYFDIWLYPHPKLFFLIGPVYSHLGFAKEVFNKDFLSCSPECKGYLQQKRDNFRLNLQVGGLVPGGFALRAGLFQGTAGVGLDWWLPFECVRWVSTFEAFDFKGHTRFDADDRPYLKWINRLFFSNNAYVAFGANDFISKRFKSGFIGVGAFFSTGDLLQCR